MNSMNSKCEMARLKYCRKSSFGYCNAEDTDIKRCPYLNAIEEIARLAMENSKLEPCIECKWFDKDNLFCDKTHDSLLWGCVCVKRFTD